MLGEVTVWYHQHPAALLWPAARGVTLPLLPRGFNYPLNGFQSLFLQSHFCQCLPSPSSFLSGSLVSASILAQQVQVEFGEQIYKECNLQGVFCPTVPKWEEKNRRPESSWKAKYAYVHLSPTMRKVREKGRSGCDLV